MDVKEGFLEAERYQLEGAGIGQVGGWLAGDSESDPSYGERAGGRSPKRKW